MAPNRRWRVCDAYKNFLTGPLARAHSPIIIEVDPGRDLAVVDDAVFGPGMKGPIATTFPVFFDVDDAPEFIDVQAHARPFDRASIDMIFKDAHRVMVLKTGQLPPQQLGNLPLCRQLIAVRANGPQPNRNICPDENADPPDGRT
jgi:hypothetical protein